MLHLNLSWLELRGSWCWVQIVKKVCFHVIIKEIWSEFLKCCQKKRKKRWINSKLGTFPSTGWKGETSGNSSGNGNLTATSRILTWAENTATSADQSCELNVRYQDLFTKDALISPSNSTVSTSLSWYHTSKCSWVCVNGSSYRQPCFNSRTLWLLDYICEILSRSLPLLALFVVLF